MKKPLILIWLTFPVVLLFVHFQWGQQFEFERQVAGQMAQAESLEHQKLWHQAVSQHDKTLSFIQASISDDEKKEIESGEEPPRSKSAHNASYSDKELLQLRATLDRAKALTNTAQISNATNILEQLVHQIDQRHYSSDLTDEVRANLAICQYYIAWHMRHDGMLRSDWMPELESSRQIFKFLAVKYRDSQQPERSRAMQKNLEAVIRLKRMDLPTLRSMELPEEGAGKGESQAGQKRKKGKKNTKANKSPEGGGGKPKASQNGKPQDSRKGGFNKYKLPKGS